MIFGVALSHGVSLPWMVLCRSCRILKLTLINTNYHVLGSFISIIILDSWVRYSLNVSILLSSMVPPTMPPFASRLEPPSPKPMNMFLCPVLPIDSRPSDLKFLVSHLQHAKVCRYQSTQFKSSILVFNHNCKSNETSM